MNQEDKELAQYEAELIAKSNAAAPKRIWLQRGYDDLVYDRWAQETTWCQDKIEALDVEYVRADIVQAIFDHFGGLDELAKWENAGGESAARVVKEYQEAS